MAAWALSIALNMARRRAARADPAGDLDEPVPLSRWQGSGGLALDEDQRSGFDRDRVDFRGAF
jgi:hypothetical protein